MITALHISLLWNASARAESATNAPMQFAFSGSLFIDVNENDASATVRVWAQMVARERGIPVSTTVSVLRGTNEIINALREHRVDAITLTAEEYWTVRETVPFSAFIYGAKDGSITEEYLLLVHRDSAFRQVSDLRGKSLHIFHNARTSLAPVWMQSLLESEPAELKDFFGRVTLAPKLTRALLPVFFKQADACIVTRQGFETASELNPQVGQQLRVMATSSELVPVVFCFRSDYRSPFRDQLLEEISEVSATPAGQQFMTLFQCDHLVKGPESEMATALELLASRGTAVSTRTAFPSVAVTNVASQTFTP